MAGVDVAKKTKMLYLLAISIDLRSVKHTYAISSMIDGSVVPYRSQIDADGA